MGNKGRTRLEAGEKRGWCVSCGDRARKETINHVPMCGPCARVAKMKKRRVRLG